MGQSPRFPGVLASNRDEFHARPSLPRAWWLADDDDAPVLGGRDLGAGVFGLSNASLDTPWPKLERLKHSLGVLVAESPAPAAMAERGFAALADRTQFADHHLPRTGIGIEHERQLSPPFIHVPASADAGACGTRCSTTVVVEDCQATRRGLVFERCFDAAGQPDGETAVQFDLPHQRPR